ncbi:hypothetical protein [Pelosinus propionicus]|uniref:Uncharacterized protein n=1 Tax=Pelosinus propionicus DSM 13327 TaxID=1123291 RepID=A0A1I4GUV2_9FIRM|nr:hypothetical protein [Pelosinus propionicus]SFL33117.1 hypothetical protein SAMN04490355_1001191 [Pelosinus propionicus DSM 13327]
MIEEKKGKYIVRWHGVKDKKNKMYSPEQVPRDMIDSIIHIILEETAITRRENNVQ